MDMIKFPVEFNSTGFTKLTDGSKDYFAQLLSIACLTEPRTHVFSPRFGVLDPSFTGIDKNVFVLNAARFVPEVEILNINTEIDPVSGVVGVEFSFNISTEE